MNRVERALAAAFARGLARVDVAALTEDALARARFRPRAVIAVGKGAFAMLEGARRALGALPGRTLAVVPDGLEGDAARVIHAGHPVPDARSARAGRAALAMAEAREPLLVLVSGGASALLEAPILPLAQLQALTRALLASGAPIDAINTARRHVSLVKGGRLAARAFPAPVLGLVVSDVLGGGLHDVGSGPTAPDPTTVADARAALRAWAPRWARARLLESPKPGSPELARARTWRVASPADCARAVAEALAARGWEVTTSRPRAGSVEEMARKYVQDARELGPGRAVVRSAEPTVRVAGAARGAAGGRSTHLALLVGPHLPRGVAFLAGATDGVDGASGTGGAVVSAASLRGREDAIARALARYDTGALCRALRLALPGGPTGNNFADVHVLAQTSS